MTNFKTICKNLKLMKINCSKVGHYLCDVNEDEFDPMEVRRLMLETQKVKTRVEYDMENLIISGFELLGVLGYELYLNLTILYPSLIRMKFNQLFWRKEDQK